MAPITSLLIAGLIAANAVFAHPGHDVSEEALERSVFIKRGPRSVRSCASTLRARGHFEHAVKRREALARNIRAKRDISAKNPFVRRSFSDYDHSHKSNLSVTQNSSESLLFTDNSSCVLQPEVTQGPYYIDGELIRKDVVENQTGVPLYLDIQIIDTSDCSPVTDVYMDLWHCNSTGVYSGISAAGNGNGDASNLKTTFLRGIQPTDNDGVVQFETIFPGHYLGRATHIHIMTHNQNSTQVLANNTLLTSNGTANASHVGQIFFDQDLISQVESTSPYNTNTQALTLNANDSILFQEADAMDPFVEYVLLGEDISDGIFAWISLGIDPSTDEEISSAATLYASGEVVHSNGAGMGGPPGSGNGTSNGTLTGTPSGTGTGSATATTSSTSTASVAVSTGGASPLGFVKETWSMTFITTLLAACFTL